MTTDNFKKNFDGGPAKYPKTNTAESDSIAVFNYIIDRECVKTHSIKNMDKVPNHDGMIEITKKDQTPIGKLEVQIKKLPGGNADSPKYQCDKKFLSYCCRNFQLPVLLILVDTNNDVAYWNLMDQDLLFLLDSKKGVNSVNVDIPKSNIIKKGDTDYVKSWIKIIDDCKEKAFNHNTLKQENKALRAIVSKTESISGEENEIFIEIHKFLDILNYELDVNYSIIKEIYYDSAWKLGYVYAEYGTSVVHSLYPIEYNKNDLQIKKVSREKLLELVEKRFSFALYFQEHPDEYRNKEYTKAWLFSELKPLFENKVFPIKDQILVREFIFAYINEFKDKCNLDVKDTFSVTELKESLQNDSSKPIKPIGSNKYWFGILFGLIKNLEETGIKDINRLYLPKNYSRVPNLIWEVWSPEAVEENIQTFFKEYPTVHDNFLKSYFPNLVDQFKYFKDFDRVIIFLEIKEKYKSWEDGPRIEYYYLQNKNKKEELINIFMSNEQHPFKNGRPDFDKTILIEEEEYSLESINKGFLDFIYEDFPMLDYLYEELMGKFESFLRN